MTTRAARTAAALCFAGALLTADPAGAGHRHVAVTGNGGCVILAKQGGEAGVTLPAASFRNTSEPATTANPHPLHVHVHKGRPGQHRTIAVLGSAMDPCAAGGDYLNAP